MKKFSLILATGILAAAGASAAPISIIVGFASGAFNLLPSVGDPPTVLTFDSTTITVTGPSCAGSSAALCGVVPVTINAVGFNSGVPSSIFTLGTGFTYTTDSVWTYGAFDTLATGVTIRTSGTYACPGCAGGPWDSTPGTLNFSIQPPASGGKYNFSASGGTVPEPGSLALMGAGLVALGFVARRRKQ